ncbi:MAG: metallophosphoesterase family protein [Chloroflexi bacterium]|nr:metallophosphoesterase family protein [Chloroflexota bacterium]
MISDIHANLAALEAVSEDAERSGADAPPWVLGDIVGYGPEPNEVVAHLRDAKAVAIAGNHDRAAVRSIGVEEFNPLAARAVLWTADALSEESRTFLSSLPERLKRGKFTLVHGSPRDPIWEYMVSAAALEENLEHLSTPGCLFGHTHIPMLVWMKPGGPTLVESEHGKTIELGEDRFYLNPGSVGQPRDGDSRASYVLLDEEAGTVEFRRVRYDYSATQKRMEQARLPRALIARLAFGR